MMSSLKVEGGRKDLIEHEAQNSKKNNCNLLHQALNM